VSQAELDLLRRLQSSALNEPELLKIYHENQGRYRVLVDLLQHPHFPLAQALNLIPRMYAVDVLRVAKNVRANPFIRQRAELEFAIRFKRLPLGEKLSLLRMTPPVILVRFIDESDAKLLAAMLTSPLCTEDVVLRFINRPQPRAPVYEALDATEWHMNPNVAMAVAHDPEAPIKILLKIIPYAGLKVLQTLFADETCHHLVRSAISRYLNERPPD
jgi:hypothetical protein